jgi:hypothetical protein
MRNKVIQVVIRRDEIMSFKMDIEIDGATASIPLEIVEKAIAEFHKHQDDQRFAFVRPAEE